MRSGTESFVFSLLLLVVGTATASPIPRDESLYSAKVSTSPRISCTTLDSGLAYKNLEVPIVHRKSAASPPHDLSRDTISGQGPRVTEEGRQIRRIMDVKVQTVQDSGKKLWSIPDVQVVLWFILLCCLTEGIVMGYRWWRGETKTALERRRPGEKIGGGQLGKLDEGDEDDEVNIPVL